MKKPNRVLILEDQIDDFELIVSELSRRWPEVECRRAETEEEYHAELTAGCDVILADFRLPRYDAINALAALHEEGIDVPYIVVSGTVEEKVAAACIRLGADDYLLKDRLCRLCPAIQRALEERELRAQRVRAEVELLQSREYYQRLLETVKAIPWELDASDWHFAYIGPQIGRFLGFQLSSGSSYREWLDTIHPEDRAGVNQALHEALAPGKDRDFVHRVVAADGTIVWMRSIVASVGDGAGQASLLRGFTVDITAQKRAEQELAQRADVLASSNKDLEDFAYAASHDLKEPLRMVSCYSELLRERYKGRLDPDADEFIAFIVDGVARMQALIRDLLLFSRVNTRGRGFTSTDCGRALDRSLENLRVAVQESGAAITADKLPTVRADSIQLAQVFQNLIGNSIKFRAKEPPRIHVAAKEADDEWIFSVRDNGIGIDPKYSETIFGLFQRLHTSQEYDGTGIGLTICRKIVERHGGKIWVESQPGSGSVFDFTIPKKGNPVHA